MLNDEWENVNMDTNTEEAFKVSKNKLLCVTQVVGMKMRKKQESIIDGKR